MGRTNSVESDECGDVERFTTIFEVERGTEEAIKRDAPVQEIAAILANKKPTPQDEATRGMNNALCGVRSITSRAWVSHDGERQVGRQR